MKSQKQKSSIVKKMMIAVAAGFGVGIIRLLIMAQLVGTDAEGVWKVVDDRTLLYYRTAFYAWTSDDDSSSCTLFTQPCSLQSCRL